MVKGLKITNVTFKQPHIVDVVFNDVLKLSGLEIKEGVSGKEYIAYPCHGNRESGIFHYLPVSRELREYIQKTILEKTKW